MEYTLKDMEYTYDVSAKTITLTAPRDALSLGQIKRIHNLTANDTIYDPTIPNNTISIAAGVISIVFRYEPTNHADSDDLLIVIDTELDYVDFDTVLFENILVQPNGLIGNDKSIDVRGDFSKTIFFDAIKNFTVSVQVTDDNGADPQWYDLCDATGTVITFTLSGDGTNRYAKSIPVYGKGIKMRVVAENTDTVADTPYCAVI